MKNALCLLLISLFISSLNAQDLNNGSLIAINVKTDTTRTIKDINRNKLIEKKRCKNYLSKPEGKIFKTKDGYKAVRIGKQIWMAKNLNTAYYKNGDAIPEIKDTSLWGNLRTGAYCYYKNNPKYKSKFGKLYNWYAVSDSRGLAPNGWHIPTESEWDTLINTLGGLDEVAIKIKVSNKNEAGENTNSSKFSALLAGYISWGGTFSDINNLGYWWSSNEINLYHDETYFDGVSYVLVESRNIFQKTNTGKSAGLSIRCVMDIK